METNVKRGRGRPEGSSSTVAVKLSDLNKSFKPDALIPVDRKLVSLLEINEIKTETVSVSSDYNVTSNKVQFSVS
jgi:hypothetical protein